MGYNDQAARRDEEHASEDMSIIDTLQSLLIAFILAFTFRGFVVEAFVIPTGSMAPTLLGAHAAVRSPHTGYTYEVGPTEEDSQANGQAGSTLGGVTPYGLTDPMLMSNRADEIVVANRRTRMGDRILVLKYLYSFFEPKRFDVVVFKNPTDPTENYIKRLIGLPDEAIWLADGDVFAAEISELREALQPYGLGAGADDDRMRQVLGEAISQGAAEVLRAFKVQRKPEHIQRAVWQPVYHSEYIPIDPSRIRGSWLPPWIGAGWQTADARAYRTDRAEPTALEYQSQARPVTDHNPYNEAHEDDSRRRGRVVKEFAVSDIRLAAAVKPDNDGLSTTIHLECRNHEFEAVVRGGTVELRMRLLNAEQPWLVLATESAGHFAADRITELEFWHVDQALWLWLDGQRVAYGEYEWTPSDRLTWATGLSPEAASTPAGGNPYTQREHKPRSPRLEWRFEGSPVTLHRVQLDRDLYYQADESRNGSPALGTHPDNLVRLDSDQFFCCGDNSSASLDGRLWDGPDPWVAQEIDPDGGVVNRKMLLGKAFFVYFPSPEGLREGARRFVPNFGNMRFIH